MLYMRKIILSLSLILLGLQAYAEEFITRIDIEGNNVVSDATIVSKIKIRAGQSYNDNVINEDVKNLYATGFFETVQAEKKDVSGGVVVNFRVKEKPVLKEMVIEGAHFIRKKKILEAIDIKEGFFVNKHEMKETVQKIKDLYNKKGFSQTRVTYELKPYGSKNEVEAKFIIKEKQVLKVREVVVLGNDAVPASRIMRLMKTKKAWLFNRGVFKKDVLGDDIGRITDFYRLQGFSDVEVDVDTDYSQRDVRLSVNISEGRRYYVGQIRVEGNKEVVLTDIVKAMRLSVGSVFSEQAVYEDSSRIRGVYVDEGYIFAQIEPFSFFNPQTEKIEVVYKISENEIAYIENIDIRGNMKTKDKVIRRQLRVYPGDEFDGKGVRKSKERLENLGFFEEIRFGTEPASTVNSVDLVVEVKEAKTGYISFGGGYSSINEVIGFAEIRQSNFDYKNFSTFTGAGQNLSLTMSMGTLTDRYQLSFTNPWIFDKPVSFGFDGYKKGHKQDDGAGYGYEQEVKGGAVRLGKEFNDYLKGGVAYRFENIEIGDIVDDATTELKDEHGSTDLSSGELFFSFDNRDNVFSPTRGVYLRNVVQLFGGAFGGDRDFFKYFNRLSFYFPLINKSVIELKLRGGYAEPFSSTDKIPIYERFFAGGASTIRGYRERKVGPIDSAADDPVGGEAMFISNIEYTYPLADFLKLATFFDAGNVWKDSGKILQSSLMSSVGLGIRVKTPIGPISVDYGWPFDLEPGEEEKEGRLHFNVSRAF